MPEPGMIAIPSVDWIWTTSALAIFHTLSKPEGSVIEADLSHSAIDAKRNALVLKFLSNSSLKWICFVDSDMVPAPDSLMQLLARERDVISASCFRRIPPYLAAFGKRLKPGNSPDAARWYTPEEVNDFASSPDPVIEVDFCGTGFLLIRRGILESMADPWFKCWEDYPGTGEDIHFCNRLTVGDFASVSVDTSVRVGHIGVVPIDSKSAQSLRMMPGETKTP